MEGEGSQRRWEGAEMEKRWEVGKGGRRVLRERGAEIL